MIDVKEAQKISKRSQLERAIRSACEEGKTAINLDFMNEEEMQLALEVCFMHGFKVGEKDGVSTISWTEESPQMIRF